MTISIFGFLAAIALPQMSALSKGEAEETRHRRNAQEVASVCAVADAAGVTFVVDGDLEQTIRNVIAGGAPTDGAFKGRNFSVKGLNEGDVNSIKKYLVLSNGQLSYQPTAKGSTWDAR